MKRSTNISACLLAVSISAALFAGPAYACAFNSLSVKLKGNQAVLSINDTEVIKFRGIPPKGGGLAGLDMGTHTDDSDLTKFTLANFQVRELVEE